MGREEVLVRNSKSFFPTRMKADVYGYKMCTKRASHVKELDLELVQKKKLRGVN